MRPTQLVEDYLTYKRALGHRFVSDGVTLRAFCRSVGKRSRTHCRISCERTLLISSEWDHPISG
jgi:hypothetical protein